MFIPMVLLLLIVPWDNFIPICRLDFIFLPWKLFTITLFLANSFFYFFCSFVGAVFMKSHQGMSSNSEEFATLLVPYYKGSLLFYKYIHPCAFFHPKLCKKKELFWKKMIFGYNFINRQKRAHEFVFLDKKTNISKKNDKKIVKKKET